ncbi:Dabb family protein [Domibacillus indicus]|uniref:Dabb family protein n=1 Tax=Domibacillus indicus TaxID=1437523 RepID=UPI00203ADE2D|nr:Dabb family protein [Domibacillus indicus]MCM3790807.1 Dabb family protein [Domibacillus indicus]
MIRHIFMFSIKQGVTEEQLDELLNDYRSLSEKVPEIIQLTVGKNLGWYDTKTTVALVADFEDEENWKIFMENPDHLNIGANAFVLLDPSSINVVQINV